MLTLIEGNLGSGKTLIATIIGKHSKKDVVSNYQLNYPFLQFDLETFVASRYDNKTILLDEAYVYMDSRNSMATTNKLMSYVLFQSRKKNLSIFLTIQLTGTIDIRYRKLVDFIIHAERYREGFRYIIYRPSDPTTYSYALLPYQQAKQYFELYNTNEVVQHKQDIFKFKPNSEKLNIVQPLAEQMMKEWEPEYRKKHPRAKLKAPNRSWVRLWAMKSKNKEKERLLYDYVKAHY